MLITKNIKMKVSLARHFFYILKHIYKNVSLVAQINLATIRHNFGLLRGMAGSRVCAMVKADAYGHGMIQIAHALSNKNLINSADAFGVATAEEALLLRDSGISARILTAGGPPEEYFAADTVKRGIIHTIITENDVAVLNAAARKAGAVALAHLKIDSGMHRLGVYGGAQLAKIMYALRCTDNVRLTGVYTHYATADSDAHYLNWQFDNFSRALKQIRAYTKNAPLCVHAANSAAFLRSPKYHNDMSRCGIALYGYAPTLIPHSTITPHSFRPAMRVYTDIAQIKTLPARSYIGYDNNYRTQMETVTAVIRAGYGDGFKRCLSNRGFVSVKGVLCPIIGNISMDCCTVDVTAVPDINIKDRVYILNEQVTAQNIANAAGTISYEILTSFKGRVKRVYV